MSRPITPVVAIDTAERALRCLAAQLTNPDPRFTNEYTVECAKALQAAAYTLFNIARRQA